MKPHGIAEWTHHEVESIIHSVARYTRFVRSTKVLLSVLVLLLVSIVLFYLLSKNENAGIRVAFTSIEKGAASPTQMKGAKFHGLDKSNQPYNVMASSATQQDENTMLLDKVAGDITLNSGVWLAMSSNTGVFHTKDKLLDLKGAIEMMDDDGYEFRTETLHVDIAKKTATTHEEVKGQGPLGTLDAKGGAFEEGNTGVITFMGPVFVTVYPPQGEKKQ